MLEPPMPHIGRGWHLPPKAATPEYPRVYSHLSISDSRNEHSSFYATRDDMFTPTTRSNLTPGEHHSRVSVSRYASPCHIYRTARMGQPKELTARCSRDSVVCKATSRPWKSSRVARRRAFKRRTETR